MGWREPHYRYPNIPGVDYKKAADSALEGAKIGFGIASAASAAKMNAEVGEIANQAQKEVDALNTHQKEPDSTAVARPEQIHEQNTTSPKLLAMMGAGPQEQTAIPEGTKINANKDYLAMAGEKPATDLAATEKMALSNVAARDNLAKGVQMKRIGINADMCNKIIMTHYEYGDVKGARELEDKFFDQTLKVASIDHKVGQKIWNNSFLKDKYGEIDLKPADKFKIVGSKGNFIKLNEATGEVSPIEGFDEVRDLAPGHKVLVKGKDENGKEQWQELEIRNPVEPTGDNLRKFTNSKGEEVTEEKIDGKWVVKATGPPKKDGDGATSKKVAMDLFDNNFIQNYGGDFVDETGKAPDKNTILARLGKSLIKGKLDHNGKPITLQQLHDAMQRNYQEQVIRGVAPAEALHNTLVFGKDFGVARKDAFNISMTPEQQNDFISGKAIQQHNPETGEVSMKYADGHKVILVAGKGAAKPTAKPAPKSAVKPAATAKAPAKKYTAEEIAQIKDIKKKLAMAGSDPNEISDKEAYKYIKNNKTEESRENKVARLASYYKRQHKMTDAAARAKAEKDIPG